MPAKSTDESAGTKGRGELVRQPHGGALKRGPGGVTKPGTGRPASAIRTRLRGSFDERIAILEAIADDPDASKSDRIKAIDMLGKYGLGAAQELTTEQVRERLAATVDMIRDRLSEDDALPILQELRQIWR